MKPKTNKELPNDDRLNTVLVVDDEDVLHETIRYIFAESGILLEHALNAHEALSRIQRGYGVVLTDIRMPEIDGIELLRRIKQIDPNVVVIVMTGYASMESAVKSTRYGAMTYLSKPFDDPKVLIDTVKKGLELRRTNLPHEDLYRAIVSGETDTIMVGKERRVIPFFRHSQSQIFRHLAESLNDGLVFLDCDGKITFANLQFARTLNFPFLELLGKSFLDFIESEKRTPLERFMANLFQQGKGQVVELVMKSRTDVAIPVLINGAVLQNDDGLIDGVMLVITDISEFRQLQDRLEMLAQLVDKARFEAIFIYNEQKKIVDCNEAAEELFGQKKGQLINLDIHSLFCDPSGQPIDFSKTLTQRLFEAQAMSKGGKKVPIEISLSEIKKDGNQSFAGGLVFIRDISERQRLEKMKEEFISTVSHELRTPLTIIKGHVENLRDELVGPLSEKQATVLGRVSHNVNRLARLIHSLLDLSRLESGQTPLNLQPVPIGSLMTTVCEEFENEFATQGIELKKEILLTLPTVYVDPDLVVQVLTNLLDNALRFAKSEVVVTGLAIDNDLVEIIVSDNGPGIALEDHKRLFNKFEQINRPKGGAGYKGTGLGLATCRKIIERQQGRIWVESEIGKGASFHFTLPQVSSLLFLHNPQNLIHHDVTLIKS